jgi:predicted DNA-binding protein YlxM (UPF0122 family)
LEETTCGVRNAAVNTGNRRNLKQSMSFVEFMLTDKQKETFLEAFKKTANMSKAARLAGVDRRTVGNAIEQDTDFYMKYRDAVEELCDDREESLFQQGRHNMAAAFGFLKAYRGHIWADKRVVEQINGSQDKLKGLLDQLKKEDKLIDVKDTKDQKK